MPVTRKKWQPISVSMPVSRARRWIMRNASMRCILLLVLPAAVQKRGAASPMSPLRPLIALNSSTALAASNSVTVPRLTSYTKTPVAPGSSLSVVGR